MILLASYSFIAWLSFIPIWGWVDVVATALVLVGVLGEWPWAMRRLVPDKPNELMPIELRREKLKKKLGIVLIVGIAGELSCLPFSIFESAEINQAAADARLKAITLEAKLRPRILQFDPAAFRAALKGKPKVMVEILYPKDDVESYDLAYRIWVVLFSEGWEASPPRPIAEDDVPVPFKDFPATRFNDGSPLTFRMGVAWGGFGFVVNNLDDRKKFEPLEHALNAGFGFGAFGPSGFGGSRDWRIPDNSIRLIVGPAYSGPNWNNGRKPK